MKYGWSGNLDDLDVSPIGRGAGDSQSAAGQRHFILAVEFVAMAVALADFRLSVGLVRQESWLQLARPRAQSHGAAEFFDAAQFAQLIDHAMRRRGIELAGVGVARPHTLRANSMHAVCMPRQMPKYGTFFSRA